MKCRLLRPFSDSFECEEFCHFEHRGGSEGASVFFTFISATASPYLCLCPKGARTFHAAGPTGSSPAHHHRRQHPFRCNTRPDGVHEPIEMMT